MEKSLDDLYNLLSQIMSRMDERFESAEKRIEQVEQQMDKLFEEVQAMRVEHRDRKGFLTFLDTKALEHEKELYYLNDRVDKYGKEMS